MTAATGERSGGRVRDGAAARDPRVRRPSPCSLENATRRADAAFEFFQKLGVEYYTFHDVDVSPQGATLKESNANFDVLAAHLEAKQKETGVKLLWGCVEGGIK